MTNMTKYKLELLENMMKSGALYSSIKDLSNKDIREIRWDFDKVGGLDLFCPYCNMNKTVVYNSSSTGSLMGTFKCEGYSNYFDRLIDVVYVCPTCQNRLYYQFYFTENKLIKIAQYPSLYQVRRDELKQYKKNNRIDENYFEEIYKADICAGEGYYVASYTYMRRVFENLIKNIFNENQEEIGFL